MLTDMPPGPRPPTVPLGARLPESFIARLDAIAAALSTPLLRVTRSHVIRAVLERGIEPLEAEVAQRRGIP
jgi:hypothetical protein